MWQTYYHMYHVMLACYFQILFIKNSVNGVNTKILKFEKYRIKKDLIGEYELNL